MAEFVEIVEVGPRDGLQNEPGFVPVADKIALIDALSATGLRRIEAASFVSPKWVPQMAGSDQVMADISRRDGVEYSALTPNLRGYQAARAADVDAVAVFAAASESFSQANINCSISESFDRFASIFEAAKADNVKVRGYISCVTDCPYEGQIAPEAVARVAEALRDAGAHEISLGETLGRGRPDQVAAMLDAVLLWKRVFVSLTRQLGDWAVVPMRQAPPVMLRPDWSSPTWQTWAMKPELTARR
jgi:hydroxymethylglutaryl-CoA lyase